MRRSLLLLTLLLVPAGCKKREIDEPQRSAMRATGMGTTRGDLVEPRALQRCFAEDSSGDPQHPLDALLDRAADRYDHGDYAGSLACAEEAARVEPRSVEAHHDRAAALQELGKLEDAASAFTRALAIDPDDPETLAGAADLYINRPPAANHHTGIGLEYSR